MSERLLAVAPGTDATKTRRRGEPNDPKRVKEKKRKAGWTPKR